MTRTRRRPLAYALAVAVALAVALAGCGGQEAASCVAPVVTVSRTTPTQGQAVHLTADNLFAQCFDQGEGVSPPATGLRLRMVPLMNAADEFPLGTVDADANGRIDVDVTVPADFPIGAGRITVAENAWVDVVVGPAIG
jgi:hypothetical protein